MTGFNWGKPAGVRLGDSWRLSSSQRATSSGPQESKGGTSEWKREVACDEPGDSDSSASPTKHRPSCSANLRATQVLISRIQNISRGQPSQVPAPWWLPLLLVSLSLSICLDLKWHTHTHTSFSCLLLPCPHAIIDTFSLIAPHPSSACHSLPQGTRDYSMPYPPGY